MLSIPVLLLLFTHKLTQVHLICHISIYFQHALVYADYNIAKRRS